jgi:ADP-ribose pyrophosphatase YjhB (NUDIX family)
MKTLLKGAYGLMRLFWFVFRPITIGVRVLAVKDGQVILVRHTYQEEWFLPGGGVKRGETLEQAIRREGYEECGMAFGSLRLAGIYTSFLEYKNDHIVLFISEDFTFSGKGDAEIAQVSAFVLDCLPADTSPGCRRRIDEYRREELAGFAVW